MSRSNDHQANDWRTSKGTKPANLDLFLRLDDDISIHESEGISVGFLWVPREVNTIADRLSKEAAQSGHSSNGGAL